MLFQLGATLLPEMLTVGTKFIQQYQCVYCDFESEQNIDNEEFNRTTSVEFSI